MPSMPPKKTLVSSLLKLVVLSSVCWLHTAASDACGEERKAAHINSPLNQSNLDKILANRGKFTAAEVLALLGPPASIETGGDLPAGQTEMSWEDVSRMELTFGEGVLVELRGAFSPRFVSQSINYPTFTKLRLGMTVDEAYKEFFLGHGERRRQNPDSGTMTLIFEQYVRFSVHFKEGKARGAARIEFLNR